MVDILNSLRVLQSYTSTNMGNYTDSQGKELKPGKTRRMSKQLANQLLKPLEQVKDIIPDVEIGPKRIYIGTFGLDYGTYFLGWGHQVTRKTENNGKIKYHIMTELNTNVNEPAIKVRRKAIDSDLEDAIRTEFEKAGIPVSKYVLEQSLF